MSEELRESPKRAQESAQELQESPKRAPRELKKSQPGIQIRIVGLLFAQDSAQESHWYADSHPGVAFCSRNVIGVPRQPQESPHESPKPHLHAITLTSPPSPFGNLSSHTPYHLESQAFTSLGGLLGQEAAPGYESEYQAAISWALLGLSWGSLGALGGSLGLSWGSFGALLEIFCYGDSHPGLALLELP